MSETEFLDLAPGDPISQDGSLRAFRYSQFSECPSAPFNTADPEGLPSQFHLSASLATSPLLELEDHNCMLNDGPLGEPSSSLLCLSRKSDPFAEGIKCNSECGEHLQPAESFSDSLGLSLFDAYPGSKKRESSPRRIYCDPRFLEEETQVSDVGVLVSKQQASHLLSSVQHLQSARQAFDSGEGISEISVTLLRKEESKSILTAAAEPEKSLPVLAVKQECHAIEDFDDICQRWHSRRTVPPATAIPSSSAGTGLPSETKLDIIKPSTSNALDSYHFRGQPTDVEPVNASPSTATNQNILAAIDDDDDADIVWRWHNRKRIALSVITNLSPSSESGPHKKLKETPEKIAEPGTLHLGQLQSQLVKDPLLDNESWSVPRYGHDRPCQDTISPRSGSETTEEDVNVNDDTDHSCDSKLLQRKLNYSCARGIKSFLQPVTARNEPSIAISSTKELGVSKPEHAEKKWTCPRKNRPGGRQRTMDAWIK